MDTIIPLAEHHEELATDLAARGVEYVFGGWIDVNGPLEIEVRSVAHLPQLLAGHERYTRAAWAIWA